MGISEYNRIEKIRSVRQSREPYQPLYGLSTETKKEIETYIERKKKEQNNLNN